MKKGNPAFLNNRFFTMVTTLLYDYLSFLLFLIFVAICFIVGKPLHYIDKKLHTHLVERLIRFFEFFA
jgi:hypothetical protein